MASDWKQQQELKDKITMLEKQAEAAASINQNGQQNLQQQVGWPATAGHTVLRCGVGKFNDERADNTGSDAPTFASSIAHYYYGRWQGYCHGKPPALSRASGGQISILPPGTALPHIYRRVPLTVHRTPTNERYSGKLTVSLGSAAGEEVEMHP